MTTFVFIIKIVLVTLGSLLSLVYVLMQFYQKIPSAGLKLTTADYIILTIVALIFGFASNNYYGLLAFVPLLVIKYLCRLYISGKRLPATGRWVEICWRKLTPRGFGRDVPRQLLSEMNRMPKDMHFVIPRLYFRVGVYFFLKNVRKQNAKVSGVTLSQSKQKVANNKIEEIIDEFKGLKKGQSASQSFPFGVIKVTRH